MFSVALLFVGWLLLMRGRGIGWKDVGFRAYRLGHSILVPMLLVVNLLFAITFIGFFDAVFSAPAATSEADASAADDGAFEGPGPVALLSVVASVVAAPFCEELFFRGILFTGFRRYYGPKRAAIFSALVFAIYHLNPVWFIGLFLSGVALAALLDATGSIWPSILLHAAWNGLIVLGDVGVMIAVVLLGLSVAAVLLSPAWLGVVWLKKHIGQRPGASSS